MELINKIFKDLSCFFEPILESSWRSLRRFSPSKVHLALESRIYFIVVGLIILIIFKTQLLICSTICKTVTHLLLLISRNSNIEFFILFTLAFFNLCLMFNSSSFLRYLKYLLIHNRRFSFDILSHLAMNSMLLFSSSYKRLMIQKLSITLLKLLEFIFRALISFISGFSWWFIKEFISSTFFNITICSFSSFSSLVSEILSNLLLTLFISSFNSLVAFITLSTFSWLSLSPIKSLKRYLELALNMHN